MPMLIPAVIAGVAAVASAAIPAISKGVGDAIARGDEEEAMALRAQAAAKYGPDILPKIDAMVAEQLGPTALSQITENESLKGSQLDALARLVDIYKSGGNTAQFRADMNDALREAAAFDQNARGRVMQELASRGALNGGLGFAGQMMAAQQGANRLYAGGVNAAAQNENRAMQAAQQAASLAGGIRAQDYGVASDRARAQDAIAQWNAIQRQNVAQQNNAYAQQRFDNEMAIRNAQTSAMLGMAQQEQQQGAQARASADKWGSAVGGTVAQLGNTAAQMYGAGQGYGNPASNQYQPSEYAYAQRNAYVAPGGNRIGPYDTSADWGYYGRR